MFVAPASKNDVQIFEQFTHFNQMRSGRWPEIKPIIEIFGQHYDWFTTYVMEFILGFGI